MTVLKSKWVLSAVYLFVLGLSHSIAAPISAKAVSTEVNEQVKPSISTVGNEVKKEQLLTAKKVVLSFQDELLNVMKQGSELGFKGRYESLKTTVVDSHDIAKITRIVVGKEWKTFSADQKLTLTDVFTRLSISSYAHNFKEFSGESFSFLSEKETARGGKIIRTVLVFPNDKDVKFDYMLKKKGDSWKIINIVANGVSDLALKRSEYTSILKRDGFDVLIAKITEKIDNYAK